MPRDESTAGNETMGSIHPCENLNYDGLYETLLRGGVALAENGEYDLSEELIATALGLRSELRQCESEVRN